MRFSFSVVDKFCPDFTLVTQTFEKHIVPVYGNQQAALDKIGAGADRLCEMLYVEGLPKGFIVYKKKPEENQLELKTLCLINPKEDSGKGLGTALLNRLEEIAGKRNATKIVVSVSELRPDAFSFFKAKGFNKIKEEKDHYQADKKEFFLSKTVTLASVATSTVSQGASSNSSSQSHSSRFDRGSRDPASRKRKGEEDNLPGARLPEVKHHASFWQKPKRPAKNHQCTLKSVYIEAIKSMRKTHEGRVNTLIFKDYQPGDRVTWFAGENKVCVEITERQDFSSFREMLETVGYKKLVPDARSLEEVVNLYDSIPGYTEKARKFGVVSFGLKVLANAPTHQSGYSSQSSGRDRYPQHATPHFRK